jgi:hypothetical protein
MKHMARFFATAAALVLTEPVLVSAQDFRVESRVFQEDEVEPVSRNLTLFRGGVVYDFIEETESLTVFDPARERFVLLDKGRRLKAEIGFKEVDQVVADVANQYRSQDDPFLQFLVDPALSSADSTDADPLILAGDWLSYRVQTQVPEFPEAADLYAGFSDGYARLNTVTNPGALPPFARMEVNAILRQKGRLPKSVMLEVKTPKSRGGRQARLRSEHDFQWRLLATDKNRIEEAGRLLVNARTVPFRELTMQGSTAQK